MPEILFHQQVTGWESFEPILSRAEQIEKADLWQLTEGMPRGMVVAPWPHLRPRPFNRKSLSASFFHPRPITAFRNSSRKPFPNWAG
jgi:hypothetical protein